MSKLKIIWTDQAKEALKSMYDYYKDKSLQGAKNVKADLLQSPKTIYFSKQYQVDDINPKYRRIIVRSYKVLYKEDGETIKVMDIVSTKQSPEILKNK
ncbi:MAG: type II toxin-antitoxin system RelE/ParE family toxin [Cyclobacteriaceae bacterium]|nr:type II toxin-antitoxin system RelE/ParE family toxin [Cyclobacteriaceae bacterium]